MPLKITLVKCGDGTLSSSKSSECSQGEFKVSKNEADNDGETNLQEQDAEALQEAAIDTEGEGQEGDSD